MANDDPRCGAKTRSGHPCQKWPILGRTRCRLHGGTTPFGVDHPSYKDGQYSKYDYACFVRKKNLALRAAFRRWARDPMKAQRPYGRRATSRKEPVPPTRCGAKNRQGNPCQKWPIKGRTRCRNHGGKSLIGTASPSFKTGTYSKWLPRNLMGRLWADSGLRRP